MKHTNLIEIQRRLGVSFVGLEAILQVLEPHVEGCRLYILDLQGTAPDGLLGRNVADIEEAAQADAGFPVSWDEALTIARQLSDLWEILLVGCTRETILSSTVSREQLYALTEFVVELVDSTEWLLFCRSDDGFADLLARLPGARAADTENP